MRVPRACSTPPIPPKTRFKKSGNDHKPAILPLRTRVFCFLGFGRPLTSGGFGGTAYDTTPTGLRWSCCSVAASAGIPDCLRHRATRAKPWTARALQLKRGFGSRPRPRCAGEPASPRGARIPARQFAVRRPLFRIFSWPINLPSRLLRPMRRLVHDCRRRYLISSCCTPSWQLKAAS
jgi:hypothetical protein